MTTEQPSPATEQGPLGAEIATAYQNEIDVIGEIDQSIAGNSILRVGRYQLHKGYWESGGAAHIVLSPAERERLIASLIRHRETRA